MVILIQMSSSEQMLAYNAVWTQDVNGTAHFFETAEKVWTMVFHEVIPTSQLAGNETEKS
uniref:Uncharacterized protein n=1 Tax=Romanomermis culicivorax TaxID=13658 RepID=A0A915ISQ1_ROMCU